MADGSYDIFGNAIPADGVAASAPAAEVAVETTASKKKSGVGWTPPAAQSGFTAGAAVEVPDVSDSVDVAAPAPPPDYDAECPICQESEEELGTFLALPCGGRHGICRPCAHSWRATCLKSGAEFSCPMCRESLEGMELA